MKLKALKCPKIQMYGPFIVVQVALILKDGTQPFCGGTIICAKFIMTAAHCMSTSAEDFFVLAGEHDLMVNMDFATRHEVEKIVIHPQFNNPAWDYDFAILELKDTIALTGASKARAACLPEAGDTIFRYKGCHAK